MVRIRNAPGYPSTAYGVRRRQARGRVQKAARLDMIAERRLRAQMPRAAPRREVNFVDLATAGYAANTTGVIGLLATIAQGVSSSQRVGKRILFKSLQVRGYMQADSTTGITKAALLIVYDKSPGAALPAVTDILNTATPQSFNNDANSGRFQILRRVDHVLLGTTTALANSAVAKDMNFFVNLKGLPSVFKTAGTGAIGDIETGALYYVVVGLDVAGTADATVHVAARVRYVDQ